MSCLVALFACFPQTSTGRELCLYVTGWRPLQQAPKADAQILINRFALGHGKLENHVLSTEVSTMTSSLVHKLHFQTHKSIFCSFSCGHEKACSVPLCLFPVLQPHSGAVFCFAGRSDGLRAHTDQVCPLCFFPSPQHHKEQK